MPLDSITEMGRLPERPWKTDALVRLVASVLICWLSGIMAAMIYGYFSMSHKTSTLPFLGLSAGGLGCFAGALFVLVRPWSLETLLRKLLITLLCIYGGFFLLVFAARLVTDKDEVENSMAIIVIGVLSLQGAALVLVHFFLREQHISWAEGFGLYKNPGQACTLGVLVGLVVLPLTWGLQLLSSLLLQALTFHPEQQETVQILQNTEGWQNRLVLGVATIIIAPAAEEILFRGILYPAIKRWGYPRLAWWVTALLFAAIHHNLATFVPLAFLAVVLIWLYEHTGNLLACIITHSLFNAVNFIALYLIQN